ncbi:Anaphase-promoting complex subunit 5 [Phytophthora cinnamomi]|uniref:Anaphase-promoting complex subunit 5 n=1 Tax=Phytophthora cinnamomi TaxID=4785 RepID=UPI00355961E6|nr:Anaphase-promoting complex subunit 5 [Phytophthora cinnamomi]
MMRKWKANAYVLSVCLLVAEYVRQDATQGGAGEDSVASLVDAPHAPPAAPTLGRTALNALARFLRLEIQHPLQVGVSANQSADFTTLKNLLRRLEISLDSAKDFEQLSWQLVSILSQIESPDAVMNTVEQISECVAPLASSREGGDDVDADSTSSTLVRTSLLGVFVRSFLLAVNRLLFDGLSRLFDDVQKYLEQFREDVEKEKKSEREQEEKDGSLELVGSPASQHLWNEGEMEEDELLLSPIHSGSATPSHEKHGIAI